jgi:hypothetical protein
MVRFVGEGNVSFFMKNPASTPQNTLMLLVPWDIIHRNAVQCGVCINSGVEKNPAIPRGVQ